MLRILTHRQASRAETLAAPLPTGTLFCAAGGLLLPGRRAGPRRLLGLRLHLLRAQVPRGESTALRRQGVRHGAETLSDILHLSPGAW